MIAQTANKKYENEWKQVEDYEQQSLPQSAAKSVDEILQKAISDKNTTQVIKALIYKNKYKKQIDRLYWLRRPIRKKKLCCIQC